MIDHKCTVFCDGQRYCIKPGTHTVECWSTVSNFNDLTRSQLWPQDVEIVCAILEDDLPHVAEGKDSRTLEWIKNTEVNRYGWLVTVRDKQPKGETHEETDQWTDRTDR